MDEDWANSITEIAKKNISPPEVNITGYVDLKSYAPNGVDVIKKALGSIDGDEISVQCVGAPRYRLMVKSSDYITAETILKEAADRAIEVVIEEGGEGTFQRELE
jgi:translation initiation factor 2 subunit 1